MTDLKMKNGVPHTIRRAMLLLWATLAVIPIHMLLEYDNLLVAFNNNVTTLLSVYGLAAALYIFIIINVIAGRNWARIVFLILFFAGFPNASQFQQFSLSLLLSLVSTVLNSYILYLLFTLPGSTWFTQKKPEPDTNNVG
ncbi:MAG: hypothetical protein HQL71_04460 [Magnetococcales bacterium]|nr:hypothetical protein [Magnetococcales bacterium]